MSKESEYKIRIDQINNLAIKRDDFLNEWLRWIVLIASGCLSVIIPLSDKSSMSSMGTIFFCCTCIFGCLGIVALSIRIYAFYIGKQSVIKGLIESMRSLDNKPITGKAPKWMMKSESVGYVFLLIAMSCFVVFACVR